MKTLAKGKLRSYILAIAALLVLLAGLLLLLYLFSKPPTSVGAKRIEGYGYVMSIYGFEGDRLNRPAEVTTDQEGNIYVADTFKHRIVVFDSSGQFIRKFGEDGKGPTELKFPAAVAVAPDGRVYVLSSNQDKIIIYKNYKPWWVINVAKPLAVTIKNNRLYLATARGVMVGNLDGKLITSFGKRGSDAESVDMPNGIAVDDSGRIYVTDSLNYRIHAFSKEGKTLWTLGKPPKSKKEAIKSTERTYGLPTGMTIDQDGYLYFVDAFNGEIVIVNRDGKEVKKIGEWGHDDGQFYYPGGLTYLGSETFAIADKFNDRVQIIRIPSPAGSPAAAAAGYGIPVAVLFLIGLILWLLRRRKNIVVIEPEFLDWALDNNAITALHKSFGTLKVADEVYERYKDRPIDEEKKLGELIEIGTYTEKKVDQIADEHGIKDVVMAKELAICTARGAKSVLLSDDPELTDIAEELDLVAFDHDEIMEINPDLIKPEEPVTSLEPETDTTPVQ
ncbi:MAG: 6-bladed beta-propeller [Candidatus Aquicultorales bacterium]